MTELRPCPFCGGEVEELSISVNGAKHIVTEKFRCTKCSTVFTLRAEFDIYPYKAIEEAWNRRYTEREG